MGSKVGGMERTALTAVEQRSDGGQGQHEWCSSVETIVQPGPFTKPWGRSNFAVFEEWQEASVDGEEWEKGEG